MTHQAMADEAMITEAKRILEGRSWYKFDELRPKAQEQALSNYAQNMDGWDDCILEDLRDDLTHLGMSDPVIGYSGFCSQGDGAHFAGYYSYGVGSVEWFDKGPWKELALELSRLQRRYFYKLRAKVTHRGHYQHENCTYIEVTHADDEYRAIPEDDEKELAELLREAMRLCYKSLSDEYDWAAGDGAKDNMRSNDYVFNAEGNDYEE